MPEETQNAINWALQQEFEGEQVTKDNTMGLVFMVREYFNNNNIVYDSFSYNDLAPYIKLSE